MNLGINLGSWYNHNLECTSLRTVLQCFCAQNLEIYTLVASLFINKIASITFGGR